MPRPRRSAPGWLARRPAFSEEDLTRFFQILLLTEDDLRRKPDPRLHLEMGLLRLVNAARLAPLEEVLAELSGNVPARQHSAATKLQRRMRAPQPNRHSSGETGGCSRLSRGPNVYSFACTSSRQRRRSAYCVPAQRSIPMRRSRTIAGRFE